MQKSVGLCLAALSIGCAGASLRPGAEAVTPAMMAEQEVLKAEQDWANVTVKHDADGFASFVHDDWIGLTPAGEWSTKRPQTARIRAGTTKYDALELSNVTVRFPEAGIAVVTGDYAQRGMAESRDNSGAGRYVHTWVKEKGKWQLVSSGVAPRPARELAGDGAAAFERIKALAGEWQAKNGKDVLTDVFRPIAYGTAVVDEEWVNGKEYTATVFYLVDGELRADHFCDYENQPRYAAAAMTDSNVVDFELRDITNLGAHPKHYHATTWRFIDANHHTQEWRAVENGAETDTVRLEFTRTK